MVKTKILLKCVCFASVLCFVSFFLVGCFVFKTDGPKFDGYIKDYYGEYILTLPYDWTVVEGKANSFISDLSLEQQANELQNAGFNTTIFEKYNGMELLVEAQQDEKIYYFIVRKAVDKGNEYSLVDLTLYNWLIDDTNVFIVLYDILFPLHYSQEFLDGTKLDIAYESLVVNATFEQIAGFYYNTRKENFVVDEDNQRIVLTVDSSHWMQYIDGNLDENIDLQVELQYYCDESQNKIAFIVTI